MCQIVLAGPDQLDRNTAYRRVPGHVDRFHREVGGDSAPEPTPERQDVDDDRRRVHAEQLGHCGLGPVGVLEANPEFTSALGDLGHGGERFDGTVSLERIPVFGGKPAGGRGHRGWHVPLATGVFGVGGKSAFEAPPEGGGVEVGASRLVPFDLERLTALERRPRGVGHHRDPVLDGENRLDAGHRLGPGARPTRQGSTRKGAAGDRGSKHPGQAEVPRKLLGSRYYHRGIEPPDRRPDQRVGTFGFERGFRRNRQPRRRRHEIAEGRLPPGALVLDPAAVDETVGGPDTPGQRRGANQHFARGGGGGSQRRPSTGDGVAPGGAHVAERGPGSGMLDPDRGERDTEFFRHDERDGRAGPLPHLRLVVDDGHRAVGTDPEPLCRLEPVARPGRSARSTPHLADPDQQDDPAGCGLEKPAS